MGGGKTHREGCPQVVGDGSYAAGYVAGRALGADIVAGYRSRVEAVLVRACYGGLDGDVLDALSDALRAEGCLG